MSTEFDPKVFGGSIERKIVNPALQEEREKCTLDKVEAYEALYSPEIRAEFEIVEDFLRNYPEAASTPKFFEKQRQERFEEWWARFRIIMSDERYRSMLTGFSHKKSPYVHWFSCFISACP